MLSYASPDPRVHYKALSPVPRRLEDSSVIAASAIGTISLLTQKTKLQLLQQFEMWLGWALVKLRRSCNEVPADRRRVIAVRTVYPCLSL